MARILIAWGLWGPYHGCRFGALCNHAAREGHQVTGVSLFSGSSVNQWGSGHLPDGVIHFELGKDEAKFPLTEIGRLLAIPRKLRPDVALLPSYHHWSLALNVASRLFGSRIVMMNDTHAGTTHAHGIKAAFKQKVVAAFHAGLVAGQPQRRYFASLGMPSDKIFTGYDAVDNDYFAARSEEIRSQAREIRAKYRLPEHYFLSLGRFVAKKNLTTLIRSYRQLLDSRPGCQTHLVMVGSGEEEFDLRALCQELKLPIYEKAELKPGTTDHRPGTTENGRWTTDEAKIDSRKQKAEIRRGSNHGVTETRSGENGTKEPWTTDHGSRFADYGPGVHFYGFRQIEENPVFYALADAFILASLYEEWGLVVNEAMACGLPVVVSATAGCAEDLLVPDRLAAPPDMSADLRMRLAQLTGHIRQNGFSFNPKSVQSLANALIILDGAPLIRESMGQASRRIVERFSCENFATNALLAARAALNHGC